MVKGISYNKFITYLHHVGPITQFEILKHSITLWYLYESLRCGYPRREIE